MAHGTFVVFLSGPKDFNGENEDVDRAVPKLGDFGTAFRLDNDKDPSTYAGTRAYWAPVRLLLIQMLYNIICLQGAGN